LASRLRILSVQPAVERAFIEQTRNDAGVLGDKKQFPFPDSYGVVEEEENSIEYSGTISESKDYAEAELIQPTKDVIEKPINDLKVKVGDAAEKNIELKVVACPDAMKKKRRRPIGVEYHSKNSKRHERMESKHGNRMDGSFFKPVCDLLNSSGYWADFIDPSTGKPILMHKMWGKMVFVGTIITTAPVGSHAVSSILAEAKN
uniref:Uncharacterized protein n=1 Tax=Parascaris equorum TaxID=6256 RepID=A0A914RG89_PAREQ